MFQIGTGLVHCVKSVRTPSYSDPYFPALGLNTEGYGSTFVLSLFSVCSNPLSSSTCGVHLLLEKKKKLTCAFRQI